MGAAQCCSKVMQDERNSELVIKGEETEKSTAKKKQSLESPIPKQKPLKQSSDEPATPGFAELRSNQSRKSEQSHKEILLVGEIEPGSPLISQKSLHKKKNDSPVTIFEVKNSLRSFDMKRLQQQEKQDNTKENKVENSEKQASISPPPKEKNVFIMEEQSQDHDGESQRSMSLDNKSVKSILKHELKYSQFRKTKTSSNNNDLDSTFRRVRFQIEKS